MATTRIIWTGDSANAPAVANNLYGIDQDTADRLVAALKSADAKRLEIRDDGHLWQVGADGTSIDIGLVNDTGALENVIIGKGAEAGSTAETVVAVGEYANVDSRQGIAVGFRAAADGTCAVAVGAGASGSGSDAVAVGDVASASARDATAVGASAVAGAEHATAVGEGAEARHSFGVALGSGSVTDADNTVSVGSGVDNGTGSSPAVRRITHVGDPLDDTDAATKKYVDSRNFTVAGEGEDSVAISPNGDAQATERRAIAIGGGASAVNDSAIAIGYNAKAEATGGGSSQVVIGSGAVGGRDAVCIGSGAGREVGVSSPRVPAGSVNVGAGAFAPYSMSVAVGEYAKATGKNDGQQLVGSDAYGSHAKATGEASVALGCYSYATESNVVSVGQGQSGVDADGERVRTRRIVNVTDPVNAQDAATKAYVDTHAASGGYTLPAATSSTLGGVKVGTGLAVTSDGTISARTYGSFDNNNTKIAIGLSNTGVMCLGVDAKSFMQKNIGSDYSRVYLGLKPATASTLGGVKIGAGINVAADGTISVSDSSGGSLSVEEYTLSDWSVTADGVKIGGTLDEDGAPNGTPSVLFYKQAGRLYSETMYLYIRTTGSVLNGKICTFEYSRTGAAVDYSVQNPLAGVAIFEEDGADGVGTPLAPGYATLNFEPKDEGSSAWGKVAVWLASPGLKANTTYAVSFSVSGLIHDLEANG